jgi:hypothetical protein
MFQPFCACGKNIGAGFRRPCRELTPGDMFGRLSLRHKALARASGSPAGGRRFSGEELLERRAAGHSKYYRFCLYSGKLTLAAKKVPWTSSSRCLYLRAGHATADACFNRSVPAAKNIGAGFRRPCRGQACGDMLGLRRRCLLPGMVCAQVREQTAQRRQPIARSVA